MRNTRLIILLSVLGGFAAVIIVMSAVFTVYNTEAACLTRYGEDNSLYPTILKVNDEVREVADTFKFQNIFLFDKQKVIDAVNAKVLRAEAVDVECVFPNKIIVKYNLVSEDLQFESGGKYVISGAGGKILKVNGYDSTDTAAGHYSESLISVKPFAPPENTSPGSYIFSDHDCYDLRALKVMIDLSQYLIDDGGFRAFEKASYAHIDLSDKKTITIIMRSGVTFKLLGGADKLPEMVQSMISWYVAEDEINTTRGVATISDNDPDRVYYRYNR